MATGSTRKTKSMVTISFPIASEKSIPVGYWLDKTVEVTKDSVLTLSLLSNASNGQFTITITGSVSGKILDTATNWNYYNHGKSCADVVCSTNETLQIVSYTNTAVTVTSSITLVRPY